jgi:hypothetical protein
MILYTPVYESVRARIPGKGRAAGSFNPEIGSVGCTSNRESSVRLYFNPISLINLLKYVRWIPSSSAARV